MPTYKFRDTNTGEIFEKFMTMSEREEYLNTNSHVEQLLNISPTNFVGEVGDGWRNQLRKQHPDWKDVINRVKNVPGSTTDVSRYT